MNNENRKNSGMGTLPLIIILGLIIGAGYFLVERDIKLPFLEDTKAIEVRRLDGYPREVGMNEDLEKQNVVITSEEELIDFLASVDKTNALFVDEKINFDKEYLIGVTSKTLSKGGHEFKIRKVYLDKEKDEILVSSRLKKPGDDCMVTEHMNMLVDLVAISKTDKDTTFETITETVNCSDE